MQTRRAPICDAEIGHRSVSACHLAVIATQLGRNLEWNPDKEEFVNDEDANRYLSREQRKPYSFA
jgi:hypothetical protein